MHNINKSFKKHKPIISTGRDLFPCFVISFCKKILHQPPHCSLDTSLSQEDAELHNPYEKYVYRADL